MSAEHTSEHAVCSVAELNAKSALAVDAGEVRVAIFLHEGRIHALNETCPHRGGPLHEGRVKNGIVRCPWHLWQFELTSGQSPVNPNSCVPTYPVRVEGDTVLVRLPDNKKPESSDEPPKGSDQARAAD